MSLKDPNSKRLRTTIRLNPDWAGLLSEIVDSILERFVSVSDYIRFGTVCKAWHNAAMEKLNYLLPPPQLPMLLVPSDDAQGVWKLNSIIENKLLPFQFQLPYCTHRIVGSSRGWLVTVDKDFVLHLFNPLHTVPGKQIGCNSNTYITLPTIVLQSEIKFSRTCGYYYFDYYVHKVVLSTNPTSSPDDYMVMAIFGGYGKLGFIKPSRDKEWSYVCSSWDKFHDIIFYQDEFYGVDGIGMFFPFDLSNDKHMRYKYLLLNRAAQSTKSEKKHHLVESSTGDLLMVQRITEWHEERSYYNTIGAKVWKLSIGHLKPDAGKKSIGDWEEMKSIGDCALFLGDNTSLSVVASDFPGCQPNSIYFAHDYFKRGPTDLGVYSMESGTFTPFYMDDDLRLSEKGRRPPIWIVPSF